MRGIKISKAMEEVHKWREEIYNETRGMPLEKKLDYFHRVYEEIDVKNAKELKKIKFVSV